MEGPDILQRHGVVMPPGGSADLDASRRVTFRDRFVALFGSGYPRLHRFLDRVSGDPELAADLAQDAFVRLYRRGSMPDAPEAWLVTVALNLFRSAKTKRRRRTQLLTAERSLRVLADPPAAPSRAVDGAAERGRVRAALAALSERDRNLLLLRASGYAYRDLARALDLNDASVGTLLARARQAFLQAHRDAHAS